MEIYIALTIREWLVSTWRISLSEIPEENHLKLIDYLNQT